MISWIDPASQTAMMAALGNQLEATGVGTAEVRFYSKAGVLLLTFPLASNWLQDATFDFVRGNLTAASDAAAVASGVFAYWEVWNRSGVKKMRVPADAATSPVTRLVVGVTYSLTAVSFRITPAGELVGFAFVLPATDQGALT